MTQERVLELLQRAGEVPLSGEVMSRSLGVSRAAVWKAVEQLRRDGYEILSVPSRGYRLTGGPDRLRAGALQGAVSGLVVGRELLCLEQVDSTSSECKRRAASGAPEGLVVFAEGQTGGRGRRGNGFQSLSGKGLYLSLLLRPKLPPDQLSALTAWTAVAVSRGIRDCCGAEPGIKWTNDLVLGGKKLCGILTELELVSESGEVGSVVIGIGVNTAQTVEEFGPSLGEVATSLAQAGYSVRRTELAGHVLRRMDEMYAAFPGGAGEFLAEYRRLCVTVGREVALLRNGARETAFAEAIEEDFSLTVRFPDGRRERISAGEVSVRGLMGYV